MCTLPNSEDPDEMQHYMAFHQGLRRQNYFQTKVEIKTRDPWINGPSRVYCIQQKEESFVYIGLKCS